MDVLVEIVRNLLIIIMVSSFLELLLPDGNIKPFARLAMGLFILVAILNPALNLLYENREFKVNLWDYQVNTNETEQILAEGQKINRRITEVNRQILQEKLEGQIEAMAMLVPGVEEVKIKALVDDSGGVTSLSVKVVPGLPESPGEEEKINVFSGRERLSADEEEEIKQKILNLVQNFYGLKNVDININFEGG